jgi:hypothetical protein
MALGNACPARKASSVAAMRAMSMGVMEDAGRAEKRLYRAFRRMKHG